MTDSASEISASPLSAGPRPEGLQLAPRRLNVRYSLWVSFLKLVLPAIAASLVMLVLLWPQLNPNNGRFRLSPMKVGVEDVQDQRLVNPRYTGVDTNNQPFAVTATTATQAAANDETLNLESPKADITLSNGTWLALIAEAGAYNQKAQSLDLSGAVSLFHDEGYEIGTTRAHIDLAAGTAEGDEAVSGHGPGGLIEAEGFRLFDKGERIIFTGKSKLVFQAEPPMPVP